MGFALFFQMVDGRLNCFTIVVRIGTADVRMQFIAFVLGEPHDGLDTEQSFEFFPHVYIIPFIHYISNCLSYM